MKVFICSLLVIISMAAVIIVATFLLLRLIMPRKHQNYYLLIPCDEHTKDVRKLCYGARLKLNLCGECSKCTLVVVDGGICEKELFNTLEMCNETDGVTVVKKEKLKDFINGRF